MKEALQKSSRHISEIVSSRIDGVREKAIQIAADWRSQGEAQDAWLALRGRSRQVAKLIVISLNLGLISTEEIGTSLKQIAQRVDLDKNTVWVEISEHLTKRRANFSRGS